MKLELTRSILLNKRKEFWKRNPLKWLEDRLGEDRASFKWTEHAEFYKDHKWDGNVNPLSKAWHYIARGDWVGLEAATGTSKTYALSRIVLWFLDCYEDSLVVTTAPKRDQLTLNLWSEITRVYNKFEELRPNSELLKLKLKVDVSSPEDGKKDMSESWMAVGFVAGTGSEEESATKAQGFHRQNMLIIIEETPGVSRAVMTAFQNTCTGENNVIFAVGNPDHQMDALHSFCEQQDVQHIRMSAYDYPNVVIGKELYPGAVTRKSIERRTRIYGKGSKMYNSRIRGLSPKSSADALIKREWIESICFFKESYKTEGEIPEDNSNNNAAGVDVANSEGGDMAAVAYGAKNRLNRIDEFPCNNANNLAYNIMYDGMVLASIGVDDWDIPTLKESNIRAANVGVDSVGVGVGTLNTFHEKNYMVQALSGGQWKDSLSYEEYEDAEGKIVKKYLYEFVSLRAQMYFAFREECRNREFVIMIHDHNVLEKITKELTTPKLLISGTKVKVESKEDIKKRLGYSPNMMDAAVYWNWMRKPRRIINDFMPIA